MIPKPNSRLMVKLPSQLRTALTKDLPPATMTNGAAVLEPEVPAPVTVATGPIASAESTNRCCCCCSSSACSKSADLLDLQHNPLLRQPVNLGSKNVRALLKSVADGTSEVKDLILNECDIIFECKACRNLFRSLCNFMDHKRMFCQVHACEKMMLYDPQRIVQESSPRSPAPASYETSLHVVEPSDAPVASSHTMSMLTTEVLTNGIQIPASRRARRLDVCIRKLTQDKERVPDRNPPALLLTPIASTTQAVFQSRMPSVERERVSVDQASTDETASQTNGLHEKLPTDNSSQQSAPTPVPFAPAASGTSETDIVPQVHESSPVPIGKPPARAVRCNICSSEFVSNKTLRVHMKTLHATQRLIYPCPFCSLTFTQICNATRHMHQVHKKGKLDVKRLREIVRMRAKVADEVSRSESPDKQESDPGFHEDMDLTPDTDRSSAADCPPDPEIREESVKPVAAPSADSETGHVCQGCNKFFPRIASKIGHEKVCDALKKPIRKRTKTEPTPSLSSSRTDDAGFHPFDSIYDNEPITITAVIKAGLQKVASTKKLKCYECPTLKFKNNVHLIRHAVFHMNEEIFACNNCVYQSLSRADIDSHAATVHGNEPVKGSPSNKIIITPSEIVTIRDEEFSLLNHSDSNSSSIPKPHRAVSAYNTTRLKSKKRVFKKSAVAKKLPDLRVLSSEVPLPPVTLQPVVPKLETAPAEPLADLPPPPPLMPQPVPLPHDMVPDPPVDAHVLQAIPSLLSSVPDGSETVTMKEEAVGEQPATPRKLASIWKNRPKKLRRLAPSIPVAPVIAPFGGQIKKRIQQAKRMKRMEVSVIKSPAVTESADVPAADPAIQPLKILIHKGVSSGKKITYAVTSVTDQNP